MACGLVLPPALLTPAVADAAPSKTAQAKPGSSKKAPAKKPAGGGKGSAKQKPKAARQKGSAPGTPDPHARATVTVRAGSSIDVVAHRGAQAGDGTVLTSFTNDLSSVAVGSGRVAVAHTAAVGPGDIRVDGTVLFANVANGEELALTVPARRYQVDIVPAATSGPVASLSCKRCRRYTQHMLRGKGKPWLCEHCDADKLARHVAEFEAIRAAAAG